MFKENFKKYQHASCLHLGIPQMDQIKEITTKSESHMHKDMKHMMIAIAANLNPKEILQQTKIRKGLSQ